METIQLKSKQVNVGVQNTSVNPITKFLNWSEEKEPYFIPFLVGMLLIQGNLIVPATVLSIHYTGGGDIQFYVAIVATMSILVSNLAVFPTRKTIPIFVIAVATCLGMTLYNVCTLLFF